MNSWATSHRYHEQIDFPCLLGCTDSIDALSHHVDCKVLRNLVRRIVSHTLPSPCLEFLGLIWPSPSNLQVVASVFHAYHSLKHVREGSVESLDFYKQQQAFAGALIANGVTVGLKCVSSHHVIQDRMPTHSRTASANAGLPPAATAAFSSIRNYYYDLMDASALH